MTPATGLAAVIVAVLLVALGAIVADGRDPAAAVVAYLGPVALATVVAVLLVADRVESLQRQFVLAGAVTVAGLAASIALFVKAMYVSEHDALFTVLLAGYGIVIGGWSARLLGQRALRRLAAAEAARRDLVAGARHVAALGTMIDDLFELSRPYMEEEARRYFESGRATFMRNWPYAFALGQKKGSKVAGKFDVAPFPEFEGGGKAAILGGHNLVISVFSENPGAALKLVDFLTSEEEKTTMFRDFSLAPTIAAAYDDDLKESVAQARSRPVSPVYPQISQAIYENVNEALAGRVSPEEALKNAQSQMQSALETF